MGKVKIIWTKSAIQAVKEIYDYYKEKSPQGAKNVRADLLNSPKSIQYAKQYQVDEINPSYRRIIVRDYKVLYTEQTGTVQVMDVTGTRQSPEILKNK